MTCLTKTGSPIPFTKLIPTSKSVCTNHGAVSFNSNYIHSIQVLKLLSHSTKFCLFDADAHLFSVLQNVNKNNAWLRFYVYSTPYIELVNSPSPFCAVFFLFAHNFAVCLQKINQTTFYHVFQNTQSPIIIIISRKNVLIFCEKAYVKGSIPLTHMYVCMFYLNNMNSENLHAAK